MKLYTMTHHVLWHLVADFFVIIICIGVFITIFTIVSILFTISIHADVDVFSYSLKFQ